jgi:hypothetical protein
LPDDLFWQGVVEIIRDTKLSGTQAKRPFMSFGCYRFEFRHGFVGLKNNERFASLDSAEASEQVTLNLVDANRCHDAIISGF